MEMAHLLELLDGTLVDTTALVDQVTGSGRLSGVDLYTKRSGRSQAGLG